MHAHSSVCVCVPIFKHTSMLNWKLSWDQEFKNLVSYGAALTSHLIIINITLRNKNTS